MINPAKLRLTTLVENTALKRGLRAEWGLCVLVEADGLNILMDCGASTHAVTHNAQVLGINLATVDVMVLSHGHYDHTGGLPAVLSAIDKEIEIIAHPAVWGPKYVKSRHTGKYSFCGIPYRAEELERLGARFTLTPQPTWLNQDIVVSGEEPMTTDFEAIDDILYHREGNQFTPDPLADDQSLYIKTELGLVIVLGCAHRGIINIIHHAQRLTGMEHVYLVVGGTHLFTASPQQLTRTVAALRDIGVDKLGVSHCTGMKPSALLAGEFGDNFLFNNTGTVIQFPV